MLIIIYVTGFISADILPTYFCASVSSSLIPLNSLTSCSSRQKALITLTPVKFSLVFAVTLSRKFCTCLYNGMLISIMAKTTIANAGIAPTKTKALLTSIVNAIIIAPKTIKGERKKSLKNRFTPFCT